MRFKLVIRDNKPQRFFLAEGQGTTYKEEEAAIFTLEEIRDSTYLSALVRPIKYLRRRYRLKPVL